MKSANGAKVMYFEQQWKRAALRRNLKTAALLGLAFSGGAFGLTWLAATSATTFIFMMIWQLRQF
jgi:hypothetical protein